MFSQFKNNVTSFSYNFYLPNVNNTALFLLFIEFPQLDKLTKSLKYIFCGLLNVIKIPNVLFFPTSGTQGPNYGVRMMSWAYFVK